MKTYSLSLSKHQLFHLLKQLPLEDCEEAINILTSRQLLLEGRQTVIPYDTLLSDLPFSTRCTTAFRYHGLVTVGDIVNIGLEALRAYKGVGQKVLGEIRVVLRLMEACELSEARISEEVGDAG